MNDRTHFVYEAYDADGLLLYVGCTGNPRNRYRDHMNGQNDGNGWFESFVTKWRVAGPYPKPVALAIERARITETQPIWNGLSIGNRKDRGLIKEYLAYHGVEFQPHPRGRCRPVLVQTKKARSSRKALA